MGACHSKQNNIYNDESYPPDIDKVIHVKKNDRKQNKRKRQFVSNRNVPSKEMIIHQQNPGKNPGKNDTINDNQQQQLPSPPTPCVDVEFDENMLYYFSNTDRRNNSKSNGKTCTNGNNGNKQTQNKNNNNNNNDGNNNKNNNSNNFNNNDGGNDGSAQRQNNDNGDGGDDEKKPNGDDYHHEDDPDGEENEDEEEEEEEEKEEDKNQEEEKSTLNIDADEFIPSQRVSRSVSITLSPINEEDEEDIIFPTDNANTYTTSSMSICQAMGIWIIDEEYKQNVNNSNNEVNHLKILNMHNQSKGKMKLTNDYDPNPMFKAKSYMNIPDILTNKVLPNRISKKVINCYQCINKTTTLQLNNNGSFTLCHDGTIIIIISYGFCDLQTDDKLYCVIEKQCDSLCRPWKLQENVYTMNEIIGKFEIDAKELPVSFNLNHKNAINKMEYMINSRLNELDINKIKWHKMAIYKRPNNTKRLTLSMKKETFIKSLNDYIKNNNKKKIKLLDILMFDNSNKYNNIYRIEYVWIIRIAEKYDIGLSFIYNQQNDTININGIHLDKNYLLEQHQILQRKHDCHCLDDFKSDIDLLIIGNPDVHENRAKDYKKRNDKMKIEIDRLKAALEASEAQNSALRKENGDLKKSMNGRSQQFEQYQRGRSHSWHYANNSMLNSPATPSVSFISNDTNNGHTSYLYANPVNQQSLNQLNFTDKQMRYSGI